MSGGAQNSWPSAHAEPATEVPMVNPAPADSGDAVSVTKSEVGSAMHHRRRREALRHPTFSEQEFGALRTADAHLEAARAGFGEAMKLISSSLQVSSRLLKSEHSCKPSSIRALNWSERPN